MKFFIPCLLVSALLIGGCDDDKSQTDPPTVFINPNFGNTDPGGELVLSIEIDVPGGLTSVVVTTIIEEVRDDDNATMISPTKVGVTDTTFTYTYDQTDKSIAGLIIDVELVATDLLGQTGTSLYRVGIAAPSVSLVPSASFAPPQSDGMGGSNSTAFFTTTNLQPSWTIDQINNDSEDVGAEIDFGYYYDTNSNTAIFASIEDYPIVNFGGIDTWSRRNSTVFRMTDMNPEEFKTAAFVEIYRAFNEGTLTAREQRTDALSVNDVVAFETNPDKAEGSKRGLIHITGLQEGDGADDFISVKITYEK